jgi:GMP synthase-like glutamine amidotransferase
MLLIKKPVLLICHSFQIACRHFNFGNVCLRKSTQIGVLPVHPLVEDPVFANLNDPLYTLESRLYQIIEPKDENINALGAKIIALEKHRPHIPLERAIMAIKFSEKMYGVQFHPEGEKNVLLDFFNEEKMKKNIIDKFGEQKWDVIISNLNDPEKLPKTHAHFIPNFLNLAVGN